MPGLHRSDQARRLRLFGSKNARLILVEQYQGVHVVHGGTASDIHEGMAVRVGEQRREGISHKVSHIL